MWIHKNSVPHSLKRQVLTQVCFYPSGHTVLLKKKSAGVLTLRYSFHFTLPWWRHWEYSPLTFGDKPPPLYAASLRATGTWNCIARSIRQTPSLSHMHNTERVIYLLWNTSIHCYSSFLSSQCGWWNTGSLHSKYRSAPFETCIYWQRNQWKKASYTKSTDEIRLPLLKWVRVVQLCIYIFVAIFEDLV